MATQQEREAFLRGWRAAMDEVLAMLAEETREYEEDEQTAASSGEYKLPGSFALKEVRGSLRARHDLVAWLTQRSTGQGNNQADNQGDNPAMAAALDALIEDRATDRDRAALGLTRPAGE